MAEDTETITPDRSYPIWSPDRAYDAAAVMLKTLASEKDNLDTSR